MIDNQIKYNDWVDNHLYLAHKFNRESKEYKVEPVGDIAKLTLPDLLNFKSYPASA